MQHDCEGRDVKNRRNGVNLAELIGICAMLGVLCGAFVPHLLKSHEASQLVKLRFNLQKLRKCLANYRERYGKPPKALAESMLESPNEPLPENPYSLAPEGFRNRVRLIESEHPRASDLTPGLVGGWLYNPQIGAVWPDHPDFLDE